MKKLMITLGILSVVACGKKEKPQPEPEGKVLKTVGEIKITEEDLSSQLPDIEGFTASQGDTAALLEGMEKIAVFYLAAKEEGLDKDPKVARRARWAERAIIADEFLRRRLEKVEVTDADISNYVKEHQDDFGREISLVEVAFQDPAMADTIKKLLLDGSYAAQKMLEYFAQRGMLMVNPIGYVNAAALRFNMPQDAAEAVRRAKRGDILGPYSTGGLSVLVMVIDIRKAAPNMAKIEPVLKEALLAERRQATVDSIYKTLSVKYTSEKTQEEK
ncbi:MAG: peptidylprolyl isomerase [candidate division WOR-3 bacterium]